MSRPVRWRDLLPTTIDRSGLLHLLAHALAAYHHSPHTQRPRHHKQSARNPVPDPADVLVAFFRCAIADGVFKPHIPLHAAAGLEASRLHGLMVDLEHQDPQHYRALPQVVELRQRPELSQEHLDALSRACRTLRESAFLLL